MLFLLALIKRNTEGRQQAAKHIPGPPEVEMPKREISERERTLNGATLI